MFFLSSEITQFQQCVWAFYHDNKRDFPWRYSDNPYHIVVSEIMLQQTTTGRVLEKYNLFITQFPTLATLACAPLHDVLSAWQGLGYNKRGKYLHESAQLIHSKCGGTVPSDPLLLRTLPGIGPATAASICAFAFNIPTLFIETNIRTVFIHSFFPPTTDKISDTHLLPLITAALDTHNPREWYYALMDYGVFLKKTVPNPNRRSCHYSRQSRFEGSDRQIRGAFIRTLTHSKSLTLDQFLTYHRYDKNRAERIVARLCNEKLIKKTGNLFSIF